MPKENSNSQEFKHLIKEVKSFDLLDIERSNVYYRLGKLLRKGYSTSDLGSEAKRAARRTYTFFKGTDVLPFPTPRELARMNKNAFRQVLHHVKKLRRNLMEQASLVERTVLTFSSNSEIENLNTSSNPFPNNTFESSIV